MNLILLEEHERLDRSDRFVITGGRVEHVRTVLKSSIGDSLVVGLRDGPRGHAVVVAIEATIVTVDVRFETAAPDRGRIDLVVAMPRPKAWKRLLSQIPQFPVDRICVLNAARVEKPYFSTQYLHPDSYRPLLDEGLMQSGRTQAPTIVVEPLFRPFVEDRLDAWLGPGRRVLLDPRGDRPFAAAFDGLEDQDRVALAIGPDTGFVPFEIESLVRVGFSRVRLSESILRTDTAAVAALGAATAILEARGGADRR